MGASAGKSYGATSQAQGMAQPQQNNPYGSLSQSMGGLMSPVNQQFVNGMQTALPQAQNNLASGQNQVDAMNNFANQQRALGGGPSGSFYNQGAGQTQIDALNNFANQQRALGGGPMGSFYNQGMTQPAPQNTMQRQVNPFTNFLSNRNLTMGQFRNPFIR